MKLSKLAFTGKNRIATENSLKDWYSALDKTNKPKIVIMAESCVEPAPGEYKDYKSTYNFNIYEMTSGNLISIVKITQEASETDKYTESDFYDDRLYYLDNNGDKQVFDSDTFEEGYLPFDLAYANGSVLTSKLLDIVKGIID